MGILYAILPEESENKRHGEQLTTQHRNIHGRRGDTDMKYHDNKEKDSQREICNANILHNLNF